MTHAEKLASLQEWQKHMEASDGLIRPISDALGLSVESPVHLAVWGLQAAYTQAISKMLGDKAEWCDWYANENDFGRKAYDAGEKDDMRPIKSLDALLWVIGGEE